MSGRNAICKVMHIDKDACKTIKQSQKNGRIYMRNYYADGELYNETFLVLTNTQLHLRYYNDLDIPNKYEVFEKAWEHIGTVLVVDSYTYVYKLRTYI